MDNSNVQTSNSTKDSICWNCKRCTGSPKYPCPWAQDGVPVDGWTAKKGRIFEIPYTVIDKDGRKEKRKKEQAYLVVKCPLYIRDQMFGSMREIYETIAEIDNIDIKSIYKRKYLKFEHYEQITGNKIPAWAWTDKQYIKKEK